jgi:hypothetical protein
MFEIHLTGGGPPCVVKLEANHMWEVGEQLVRHRFLTGLLVEEGGQPIEPPREVLTPAQQIRLVAAAIAAR